MAFSASEIKAKGIAKSKSASRILTGDKEIDRKLERLKTGVANKIVRRGMTKALRLITKGIKSEVPSPYKDAKRAIGYRFDKKGGASRDQVRAKAGAGVGKQRKPKERGKGRRGVGISGANIHWAILGTDERQTKTHPTGVMPPIMPDIVKAGFNKTSSQAMAVIASEVTAGIEAEAAK